MNLAATLSQLRRHLHRNPELGFEEHETSAFLRGWLEERGFETVGPLAGTGFYVDIAGRRAGATTGYRADMDALPVMDAKEVPYASTKPGVAHLCGHDAHMATACGVLVLLQERQNEIAGRVRVFFQPNEERPPSGAPRMIADGVLDGLDAVYAIHVDPTLSVGRFGLRAGAITAACAPFLVRISTGRTGGHSARPHETVDTVWLATQIATQYYQLAGRVADARKTSIITICRFEAGDALNVIPSDVEMGGMLRCADAETFAYLRDKMRRVAGSAGALYGADVAVEFVDSLPAVMNTEEEVAIVRDAATALFGADAPREVMPSMGGEDFAFYLERIPGAMVRVGSASGSDTRYPLHHQRFDVDEAALPLAARLMAETLARSNERPRAPRGPREALTASAPNGGNGGLG